MNLKLHPAAELFPLMNESELRELAKDIRTHGQKEPCVFYQDQLLDGRNRWRACQLLGMEPEVRTIDGYKGFDPLQFVISTNLHRRHLSGSQRAMIAARARSVYQARAKQRRRDGGKAAGRGRPQSNKKKDRENLPEPIAGRARDQAGATVGVSGKSVDQATTVLVKGSRKLQQAVDAGQVAVSRAAVIAKALPKREQLTKANEMPKRKQHTPFEQLKYWWGKSDPAAQTRFRLWIDKQLT